MSFIIANLGWIISVFVAVILLIILMVTGYVKAPPDTAYLISGLRKKIIIGKASIKIPFFERLDKLALQLIPIDVQTSSAVPTAEFINVFADANVNVKISSRDDLIAIAAENFLNKNTDYIGRVACEVLEGNMREIIGQMTLEEMVNDRKKFAEKVQENAAPDLEQMGLEIVSFNVQSFRDEQGLIDNLGIDNTVKIQKRAAIAKADAEKEIAVAQAKAKQEANDAQVAAQTEIERKRNELEIQKAELKKASDIKKAEADAAYAIQEEEQRKTIETTTANANLAKLEKEIELKEKSVAITERALEAAIKKKAEAQQIEAERRAEAEKAKAQAELYKEQQIAEAEKARSEAQRIAMENEAAGIRAKGEAEAAAIQAKALAEAEGILKKAEAMKKYGDAATMDMQLEALKVYFNTLPAIAQAVAEPMAQIDKITMYGEGNTVKLTGDIMTTINQVNDGLKVSMGIDIQSILGGVLGGKLVNGNCDCE